MEIRDMRIMVVDLDAFDEDTGEYEEQDVLFVQHVEDVRRDVIVHVYEEIVDRDNNNMIVVCVDGLDDDGNPLLYQQFIYPPHKYGYGDESRYDYSDLNEVLDDWGVR